MNQAASSRKIRGLFSMRYRDFLALSPWEISCHEHLHGRKVLEAEVATTGHFAKCNTCSESCLPSRDFRSNFRFDIVWGTIFLRGTQPSSHRRTRRRLSSDKLDEPSTWLRRQMLLEVAGPCGCKLLNEI